MDDFSTPSEARLMDDRLRGTRDAVVAVERASLEGAGRSRLIAALVARLCRSDQSARYVYFTHCAQAAAPARP